MSQLQKILLVDDVPLFLELEQSFLKGLGAEVITAVNGREAVEKARAERPDLIVMDLIMPEMNGDEACKLIKKASETQKTPVILVTAQGTNTTQAQCEASGCDAVLFKPLKRNDLLDRINRLLSGARQAPIGGSKRNILLVEESRFYASLLSDVLASRGYGVDVAANGKELLEKLEKRVPDLILLDIIMPNLDAPSLIKQIRANSRFKLARIAALTSLAATDPLAKQAIELGVVDFITKTTAPGDIAYRVDEILFAETADTRRASRYNLRVAAEYKKGQFWIAGEVANASETGIYLKALELPEKDVLVQVRFTFPRQQTQCEVEGKVVWIRSPDSQRSQTSWGIESGFGIRLAKVPAAYKKCFAEFAKTASR